MIDPQWLRGDPTAVAENLARRQFQFDQQRFATLESQRKSQQSELEQVRAERNRIAKAIGQAKRQGENAENLLEQAGMLSERENHLKAQFATLEKELHDFLLALPNRVDDSVPEGADESANVVVRTVGEKPSYAFQARDHVTLGSMLGGLDTDAAARIAGSRFAVFGGAIARLHRALIGFMLDLHRERHGYREMYVPGIVNAESLLGTSQLPKFEDDLFHLEGERNWYLTPTGEVPLTNLVRGEILAQTQLPIRIMAHTPCFRSEAGSYGRDTRGIIRQHQFEKVELVQIVHPNDSYEALETLTAHAEAVLQALQLPYRVVALAAGDLGFGSAKTYDLEVWLPGQSAYREISSCSNFEDFQARRMQARFREDPQSKPQLVHTLNGSGLAVGRTLVAILENYQQADGSVRVPTVLQDRMNGLEYIRPPSNGSVYVWENRGQD